MKLRALSLRQLFGGNDSTPPLPDPPVNSVAPLVSGNPYRGETITCGTGTWDNGPTGYIYQWIVAGNPTGDPTSSNEFVIPINAPFDAGYEVGCLVTASNAGGEGIGAYSSNSIGLVQKPGAPELLEAPLMEIPDPVMSGATAQVNDGYWTAGDTFTYQWYANGVAIDGATSYFYEIPVGTPTGVVLTVEVTAVGADGSTAAFASNSCTVVWNPEELTLAFDFREGTADERITFTGGNGTTRDSSTDIVPATAPRFDYAYRRNYPAGGGAQCIGILFERATVTLLPTADFADAAWDTTGITLDDGVTGPDGSISFRLIRDAEPESCLSTFTSVSDDGLMRQQMLYVHPGTHDVLIFRMVYLGGTAAPSSIVFTPSTGQFFVNEGTPDFRVELSDDGWVRLCIASPNTDDGNIGIATQLYLAVSGGAGYVDVALPMLAEGKDGNSYVIPDGATTARDADRALMTGTDFSDWYVPHGCFAVEFDCTATGSDDSFVLHLGNAGQDEQIRLVVYASILYLQFVASGVGVVNLNLGNVVHGGKNRVAFLFESGNIAISLNGAAPLTSNEESIPDVDKMGIGCYTGALGSELGGHVGFLKYWRTLPSLEQLQEQSFHDPFWDYVTLLTNLRGNSLSIDDAIACPFNLYGSPIIDPNAIEGGAMVLDGSNYVEAVSVPPLRTGDFCIDIIVQCFSPAASEKGILQYCTTAGGLQSSYANAITLYKGTNWGLLANSQYINGGPSSENLTHLRVSRHGTSTKFFVDGELMGSVADAMDYTGTYIAIGGYYNSAFLSAGNFLGVRVTLGKGREVSSFTPSYDPFWVGSVPELPT